MFSLLIYKRYLEFWRDMWVILRAPLAEVPLRYISLSKDEMPNTSNDYSVQHNSNSSGNP